MLAQYNCKERYEGSYSSYYAYAQNDEGKLSGMDKEHYDPYKGSEEKHVSEGLNKPSFTLCGLPGTLGMKFLSLAALVKRDLNMGVFRYGFADYVFCFFRNVFFHIFHLLFLVPMSHKAQP